MKKAEYNKLMEAEKDWIPSGSNCIHDFWIGEFTHIVVTKSLKGKYQIIRSWYMNQPAISVDVSDGKLEDVVDYFIRKILENQTTKFKLEED